MKKRKPWYRARNVVLLILAAGLIWLAWAVYFAMTAKPGNAIDYAQRITELARNAQPGDIDGPNRWDDYIAEFADFYSLALAGAAPGTKALGQSPDISYAYDTSRFETPQDAEIARLEALANLKALRESGVFERADAFVPAGPIYRQYTKDELVAFVLMPDLSYSRVFARVNRAEFHTAIAEARDDDALRCVRRALSLAKVPINGPNLISWLVGIAQYGILFEGIREETLAGHLSPETARRILDELNKVKIRSGEIAIEGERLGILDIVERSFTDDGHGGGILLVTEVPEGQFNGNNQARHPRITNLMGFFLPGKKDTVDSVNEVYDFALRCIKESPAEQQRLLADFVGWAERRLKSTYLPLEVLIPAFDRAFSNYEACVNDLALTRVGLALSIYNSEHGEYPESLDQLVPNVFPALPKDRFTSDGTYGYVKRAATPDDPREFLLYSFGFDGVDHRGTLPRGGIAPSHAYSPGYEGTDFVFNPNPLATDADQ